MHLPCWVLGAFPITFQPVTSLPRPVRILGSRAIQEYSRQTFDDYVQAEYCIMVWTSHTLWYEMFRSIIYSRTRLPNQKDVLKHACIAVDNGPHLKRAIKSDTQTTQILTHASISAHTLRWLWGLLRLLWFSVIMSPWKGTITRDRPVNYSPSWVGS